MSRSALLEAGEDPIEDALALDLAATDRAAPDAIGAADLAAHDDNTAAAEELLRWVRAS